MTKFPTMTKIFFARCFAGTFKIVNGANIGFFQQNMKISERQTKHPRRNESEGALFRNAT
jgi:hypothetical protein